MAAKISQTRKLMAFISISLHVFATYANEKLNYSVEVLANALRECCQSFRIHKSEEMKRSEANKVFVCQSQRKGSYTEGTFQEPVKFLAASHTSMKMATEQFRCCILDYTQGAKLRHVKQTKSEV